MAFQNPSVLKYDPYRKFKFLVKWNGKYVVGAQKITSITKSITPVDWRAGGDANHTAKLPGQTKFEAITIERGLCADTVFMDWMNLVNTYQGTGGTSGESVHGFRKDLTIEMYNLTNELVMTIAVYKAWPSKLTVADFDAKANELAIEVLELQNEGFDIVGARPPSPEERQ